MKYIHLTIRNTFIVFIMALGVSTTANATCCWGWGHHHTRPPVQTKGSVNGSVFEDTNGNGHKDANEHFKAGVQVEICFTPKSVTSQKGRWHCGIWHPTCKHGWWVKHWVHTGCCTGFWCPGKPETTTPQKYCVTKTTNSNGRYSVANAPAGGVKITLIETTLPAGSHLTTHNNPYTSTLNAGGVVGTHFGYDVAKIASVANATEKEGKVLKHRVTFTRATTSQKTYDLRIVNGTAHAGEDFEATPRFSLNSITYNANTHKITVPAGISNFNIKIKSLDDTKFDEDSENYTIELEDLTATGTILDKELPTVVLSPASAKEGDELVHTAAVTESTEALVYNIRIVSKSAKLGEDFNGTPEFTNGVTYVKESTEQGSTGPIDIGKITVPAHVTNFEMKIQAYDDNVSEGEENYIAAITYGGIIHWDWAKGTIIDDTEPTVLSVGNAHNTEGSPLVHEVKLIASKNTVQYTLNIEDGTATAGQDYVATPTFSNSNITYNAATKILYVPANISDFNVSVESKTDDDVEGDETYTITVSKDETSKTGTGTIEDGTDAKVKSITPASATEGSPLVHEVEVTSSNEPVTYDLTIEGSGTAPATKDVDFNSEINCSAGVTYDKFHNTITVPANISKFDISVKSKSDADVEGDETYTITIGNTEKSVSAIGTIVDSNEAVVISVGSATAQEGHDLIHAVEVTNAPTEKEYNLNIIDVSTNTNGTVDYNEPTIDVANQDNVSLTNGVITVAAGTTNFNIVVHAKQDDFDETNETYIIKVGDKNNTGTITDDPVPVIESITSAAEEENLTLTHTVTVTNYHDPVTYDFSIVDNNTTRDLDYNSTPIFTEGVELNAGKITVPAGVSSFDVKVKSFADDEIDPDEKYTLNVGDKNATGTIIDTTEQNVTVESIEDAASPEDAYVAHEVTLSANPNKEIILHYSFKNITTDDNDYVAIPRFDILNGGYVKLGENNTILVKGTKSFTLYVFAIREDNDQSDKPYESYEITVDGKTATGTIRDIG